MSTPSQKVCPVCGKTYTGRGYVIGISSTGGATPLFPNIEACSAACQDTANAKRPRREGMQNLHLSTPQVLIHEQTT